PIAAPAPRAPLSPPTPTAPITPPLPPPAEAPLPSLARLAAEPAKRASEGDGSVVDLLWFDAESMPRIRRVQAWRPILHAVEEAPLDPELDDPEFSRNPAEAENRRGLGELFVRTESLGAAGLAEALRGGARRGTFAPKLGMFAGELWFPFDEVGVLRATAITL